MNKDILIINADQWFFEPFLDLLDFEKISYDYCHNGSDALKAFQKNAYLLVILDMEVSLGDDYWNIDGYDVPGLYLLEKIKKQKPDLPVICFTVMTEEEVVRKIADLGGKHIAKGSGAKTLINKIKALIESTDYLILGNQELKRKKYEQAELYFNQEIVKNREHANAWVLLAQAYLHSDKLKDASKAIDEAIELDEKNPKLNDSGQLSLIKAEILKEDDKDNDAKNVLEEIVKLNPRSIKARLFLEDCKQRLQKKDGSTAEKTHTISEKNE
jgi:tetratricopeptide (TPR) repeat protein